MSEANLRFHTRYCGSQDNREKNFKTAVEVLESCLCCSDDWAEAWLKHTSEMHKLYSTHIARSIIYRDAKCYGLRRAATIFRFMLCCYCDPKLL